MRAYLIAMTSYCRLHVEPVAVRLLTINEFLRTAGAASDLEVAYELPAGMWTGTQRSSPDLRSLVGNPSFMDQLGDGIVVGVCRANSPDSSERWRLCYSEEDDARIDWMLWSIYDRECRDYRQLIHKACGTSLIDVVTVCGEQLNRTLHRSIVSNAIEQFGSQEALAMDRGTAR